MYRKQSVKVAAYFIVLEVYAFSTMSVTVSIIYKNADVCTESNL